MNHDKWLVTAGNGGAVITAAQPVPGGPMNSVEQVIADIAAAMYWPRTRLPAAAQAFPAAWLGALAGRRLR